MAGGNRAVDMLGKRFGVFRVTARAKNPNIADEHAYWQVECEACGFIKVASSQNIARFFPLKCTHVPAGYRVVGPREVAVLDAVRGLDSTSVTILEDSGWKPLVALAAALEATGGE